MKYAKIFLPLLIFGLLFSACKQKPNEEPEVKENVIFRSATVAEGSEVPAETTIITLAYNRVVDIAADAAITLNGEKVVAVNNATTSMKVDVQVTLAAGTEYELVVPSRTIFNRENANETAKELRLHFHTAKPYVPTDNDAAAFLRSLGYGWNLGNHFDSYDSNNAAANYKITWNKNCPYWDGTHPTQALYDNLAAAGVKTVRMPVTWGPYEDMSLNPDGTCDYTIDPAYVAEIRQNIDWAISAGLYVLLNTHHDEYWQDVVACASNDSLRQATEDRITKTWTQIAEAFKDYGDLLLFETFNELHDDAWGWQAGRNYAPIFALMDSWNQLAVDAIRATGSKNATRWIGVPGFCANPTFTNGEKHRIVIPNDPASRIMVAVHTYDPFDFCTAGKVARWGHTITGNNSQEKQMEDMFLRLSREFVDNNIPCYFGEFGVVARTNAADEPFRAYYLEYICRCSYTYGIPLMLWDNNATSGEVFHYVSHTDGTLYEPELIKLMVNAATSTDPSYTLQSVYNRAPK